MKDRNVIKIYSLFNATSIIKNAASVGKIYDISGAEGLVCSVYYKTTAGEIDLTYETSLDGTIWVTHVVETTLDGLTVGSGHVAITLAVLTKYIRFTATEKNIATTIFTANLAIR